MANNRIHRYFSYFICTVYVHIHLYMYVHTCIHVDGYIGERSGPLHDQLCL